MVFLFKINANRTMHVRDAVFEGNWGESPHDRCGLSPQSAQQVTSPMLGNRSGTDIAKDKDGGREES